MSEPIITTCPTLTNPDAISDVAELRQELHRANKNLLDMTERLSLSEHMFFQMRDKLASVMLPHMADKPDKVKAALDKLVAEHHRVLAQIKGGLH